MFQKYSDPESNRDYLGNPLLTDGEFFNAEARYEWYFASDQRFSVAGFYKEIDKPIEAYTTYPEGDTPGDQLRQCAEGAALRRRTRGAEVSSARLTRVRRSSFLAARRAVVIGNYTYTSSKIQVGAERYRGNLRLEPDDAAPPPTTSPMAAR